MLLYKLKEPHNTKRLCFQSCHVATLGDHPQEQSAKFGYRSKRKEENFKNPIIFWQLTGSWNLLSKIWQFQNFVFPSKSGDFGAFLSTKILWLNCNWIFFVNKRRK